MLRTSFLIAPLLAFALPFALPDSSAARPLSGQTPQTEFCYGDGECGEEESTCEDITICISGKVEICGGDAKEHRAACHASCTQLAADGCSASLGGADYATRSRCESELTTRCELDCARPKTLEIFDPARGGKHDDYDDDDGDGGGKDKSDCEKHTGHACIHISRD